MFSSALYHTTAISRNFCRNMSTKPMRAYPVYTVYGADCYFNLKVILPKFRTRNNVVSTEGFSQNGSLLLEWVPRGSDGECGRSAVFRLSQNIFFLTNKIDLFRLFSYIKEKAFQTELSVLHCRPKRPA